MVGIENFTLAEYFGVLVKIGLQKGAARAGGTQDDKFLIVSVGIEQPFFRCGGQ